MVDPGSRSRGRQGCGPAFYNNSLVKVTDAINTDLHCLIVLCKTCGIHHVLSECQPGTRPQAHSCAASFSPHVPGSLLLIGQFAFYWKSTLGIFSAFSLNLLLNKQDRLISVICWAESDWSWSISLSLDQCSYQMTVQTIASFIKCLVFAVINSICTSFPWRLML